jgi:hypothetical protein
LRRLGVEQAERTDTFPSRQIAAFLELVAHRA